MSLLEVENARVAFPTARGLLTAVDGVSLSVDEGRVLGIVGESGSGKSVLSRAIMGLLPRSARTGEAMRIRLGGRELGALPERELRRLRGREMAMIFQDPMTALNPVMTLGDQIGESLRLHLGMGRRQARDRSVELLAAVGLPQPATRVDQHPHQLSGGMRQRVAIAIALACDPRLLIADEPTTALDVTVQHGILDLLQAQSRERGMAMILITHDLGVVAGRADEVAVMYAGRVVEQAPTRALFAAASMPYTRGLLASIPRIEDAPGRRLEAIGGRPPDLVSPPAGCAFSPRCAHASDLCRRQAPGLEDGGATRFACWHPALEAAE
ncbi:ABC transporter ATP-binding protein [Albimonas pacifica]|uniref:Peptide/nickel transport system ATP-binding protein n=1 Tax=Albimonas pacifica TaxID=1114924 RepID=A0A1I3ND83_9RHOB|nr:ABC transporter ATP-binding protein [Albimonas pacifica]SFJ07105.1 peptide/nickel transport system ATP-binding protein [Albimonas pacifica]